MIDPLRMATITELRDGRWEIAGVDPATAEDLLTRYAPWRMQLSFRDGPSSDDFETFQPFNAFPLRKLRTTLGRLELPPIDDPGIGKGPSVLDVGFNCGYNSLYMASRFGAAVTGIDVLPRHKALADELAALLGLDVEFRLEDAEDFERPDSFDLILHFGTLYHLPNPLRSMASCARSLKAGGWFALETIRYLGPPDCARWIYGLNGDRSNYWALGDRVIEEFFQRSGLEAPRRILDAKVAVLGGDMSRAIWIARKDSSSLP